MVPMVSPRYFGEPGTISHHALASLVMSKISAVVLRNNLRADVSRSVSRSTVIMSGLGIYGHGIKMRRHVIPFSKQTSWLETSPEFPLSLRWAIRIHDPSVPSQCCASKRSSPSCQRQLCSINISGPMELTAASTRRGRPGNMGELWQISRWNQKKRTVNSSPAKVAINDGKIFFILFLGYYNNPTP